MKTRIVIPTLNRVHDQVTLDSFPKSMKNKVMLCMPESELPKHLDLPHTEKCSPLPHPDNLKGISQVREWVKSEAIKSGWKKLFFCDDDMRFYVRKAPGDWHLRYMEPDEIPGMFDMLEEWLEEFQHVGISARQGNNNNELGWDFCCRMCNFYGYNVEIFKEHPELSFATTQVMEDFQMCLELITRGWPNFMSYNYAWGQKSSNAPGGCSTYRNAQMQAEAAEYLAGRFPDFVKVVEKKPKTGWEGMEVRKDVRVQWKKAYSSTGLEDPQPPKRL